MATRTSKTNNKKSGNGKRVETKPAETKSVETKTSRKPASKKTDVMRSPKAKQSPAIPPEARWEWVRTAAYFLAENDGFSGDPASYWLAAERQVPVHE